jgi:signal transduction histidine kinase
MRNPLVESRLEIWERRERPALVALPYVMLVFTAVLTAFIRHSAGESWWIDQALCGMTASWMLWMHTLHPAWRRRLPVMAVFFAGLVALMAVLVIRDPWFGFFTFTGYFYAYDLPPKPRLLGVAAVAILTGTSQAGGLPHATAVSLVIYISVILVNLALASAITWFSSVSYLQNERRKRLVDELSEANSRLEATLAENAGLHEQLLVQAREAGVLDERQRMAREIHDTLAQGLTGIVTQLQAAEQSMHDPEERRRHFGAAVRLARESLTEARRSVHALRPVPLETARLSDALAGVAGRWTELNGIPVNVTTTGTVRPMPPDAELALLRTAQEALANVGKHARATRVGLTLSYMEDEVVLDVRDDGRGFDSARSWNQGIQNGTGHAPDGGGFGLVAMRQRIEGLSGTLQVESEPGLGTAISACVPESARALT